MCLCLHILESVASHNTRRAASTLTVQSRVCLWRYAGATHCTVHFCISVPLVDPCFQTKTCQFLRKLETSQITCSRLIIQNHFIFWLRIYELYSSLRSISVKNYCANRVPKLKPRSGHSGVKSKKLNHAG